jgi:bla regulator protein blaR1
MNLRKSALVVIAFTAVATSLAGAQSVTSYGQNQKYSYALTGKEGHSFVNNGDGKDFWSARQKGKADTLYVRKSGKTYTITDKATIAQMRKAIEPMVKIGKKQGEIGAQQSKIGEQQSKIGEKQGELGRQMGEVGSQMGELATRQYSDEDREAKQEQLQKKMEVLQNQMDKLNGLMDKPSRQQEELGKKQGELGKQQEKASVEAQGKIEKIIDEAFAKGLAKPVRH